MGQVTIYLDNETEDKLKKAAQSSQVSVSRLVADMIRKHIKTEWPRHVVDLAGSWKENFPSAEGPRSLRGKDSPREEL